MRLLLLGSMKGYKVIDSSLKYLRINYKLVLSLCLFSVFSVLYHERVEGGLGDKMIIEIDSDLLTEMTGYRSGFLTLVFREITALGSGTALGFVVVANLIWLIANCDKVRAIQLLVVSMASSVLTLLFKIMAERPRPDIVDHLDYADGYSFPSGHSLSSSAIYFTILFQVLPVFPRWKMWILGYFILLVIVVSISRIYLGVHYPSDVLAGFCFGTGLACLSEWFTERKNAIRSRELDVSPL